MALVSPDGIWWTFPVSGGKAVLHANSSLQLMPAADDVFINNKVQLEPCVPSMPSMLGRKMAVF
jgi:hypothetical protein